MATFYFSSPFGLRHTFLGFDTVAIGRERAREGKGVRSMALSTSPPCLWLRHALLGFGTVVIGSERAREDKGVRQMATFYLSPASGLRCTFSGDPKQSLT